MTAPVVSIIVPCYNQAEYLPEALDSILAQIYSNWECIIVNDGSHDNTKKIAEAYLKKDNRFKYCHKENGGLSSARNAGIKVSIGKFILPLDADDKIGPSYLELALSIFENNLSVKLVYAEAEKFGLINEPWRLSAFSYQDLLLNNNLYCSSIFRKVDYDKTLGYDESMKNGYEDWDFWLQVLNKDSIVHRINEVNFFYRQKGYSTVYSDDKMYIKNRNYIFKKHIDKYLEHFPDPIGIFLQNKALINRFENSVDYKIGHALLSPLRKVFRLLKKK